MFNRKPKQSQAEIDGREFLDKLQRKVVDALADGLRARMAAAGSLPEEILEKVFEECVYAKMVKDIVGIKRLTAEVVQVGDTLRRLHGVRLKLSETVALVVTMMAVAVQAMEDRAKEAEDGEEK